MIAGTPNTIAAQVAGRLRAAILGGEYAPGEALPPERALAVDLGTNRNTLREAIRALDESGLVRARQGHGVRVLDFRGHGRLDLLPAFLATDMVPVHERVAALIDAMRFRSVFLVEAAALAAQRRNDEDVRALRRASAAALLERDDVVAAAERELDFFGALVGAAHSQIATWALNTFAKVVTSVLERQPALWVTPDGFEGTLRRVVLAIESADPAAARRAMRTHLESSDAVVAPILSSLQTGDQR